MQVHSWQPPPAPRPSQEVRLLQEASLRWGLLRQARASLTTSRSRHSGCPSAKLRQKVSWNAEEGGGMGRREGAPTFTPGPVQSPARSSQVGGWKPAEEASHRSHPGTRQPRAGEETRSSGPNRSPAPTTPGRFLHPGLSYFATGGALHHHHHVIATQPMQNRWADRCDSDRRRPP